ncbi:alpha/beta-hydrolase [Tothia fuscella]|uniref:cutinase n=1 Tax=Tothia fuscella TaxID=1048955 RepID=A0A9P4NR78_9PEZI|nr:alpha/beta-hydrolase [Tothia fuscella]
MSAATNKRRSRRVRGVFNKESEKYQKDSFVSTVTRSTPTPTPEADDANELEKRQACTPYVLLYARGTTETGDLGLTVGPALAAGIRGKDWTVRGISSRDGYYADLPGIYCIGLPGGLACKDVLNKMSKSCPNSKFVTSGYSQGAMVARECVAFAEPEARAKVIGILTYGDPFNGATVKGFPQDKIKINCNPTDGVCKGDFSIGLGHLSYSTTTGVAWLKSLEKKG